MSAIGCRLCAVVLVFVISIGIQDVAADDRVNLLKVPQAVLEATSLVGDQAARISALTDAKSDTSASFDPKGGANVDLVFGFGGQTVALETIAVTLAKEPGSKPPARVEVLASTVSPQSAFTSLRVDPLDPAAPVQRFNFRPTAARWIMIRLTAAPGGSPVSLAEIAVLGRPGPPRTYYAFSETPARSIDILSRLETVGAVKIAVSPDEKLAFQKAQAGDLDPAAFADMALLASGVLDASKRRDYLRRIDALEAQARLALVKTRNSAERADALLRWLHREVLKNGYRSEQSDLAVLLDTKTFNCVSSAVIYNILALRLRLDVRAIEVPDHAFSIVYDGTAHMDVETTTPLGFNPARDQIEAFERMTGFRYIPQSHRDQRREIGESGLAALIYYNRGVELSRAKRHHDALLAYFRAMSLDPEFVSAAKNALATLANWSIELSEAQAWKQALEIAAAGVALAPKDAQLTNNHVAVWNRWAMSLADAGKPEEAIAVLKQAAAARPDGGFEAMQAWVYIKPGEASIAARNWPAAFATTEAGLAKLDPGPRQDLVAWRDNLFPRWASAEIRAGQFEAAASVLSLGLSAAPTDPALQEMIGYLGQEWAKAASSGGYTQGLAALSALDRRFASTALNEAAKSYISRQVVALAEDGRVDEALMAIVEAGDLLKGRSARSELGALVFDTGAKARLKARAWEAGADLYAAGLKQFPENEMLKNNAAYMAQEWHKAAFAKGGTEEVASVTAKLAVRFPNSAAIAESGRIQVRATVGELAQGGDFGKALALLKDASAQLTAADRLAMNELIYDNWARQKIAAKDWDGAAEIYATGFAAVGASGKLQNSVVYLTQEWQNAAYASGGTQEVAAVTTKLAARFPNIAAIAESGRNHVRGRVGELAKAGDFDKALAVLKDAAPQLTSGDVRALNEIIYDNWGKQKIAAKDWVGAAGIYATGLNKAGPSDRLNTNIVFLAQEWARASFTHGGIDAMTQMARQAAAIFPSVPNVRQGPAAIVRGAVIDKAQAGEFEAAIALAERGGELLPQDWADDLLEFGYDKWARSFFKHKQWPEAIKTYDRGLKRLPDSGLLKQNRAFCLDQLG